MTNEVIIERLRKLIALAENAGTEAEASTAMSLVQEILTKYNLSMGDVGSAKDEDEDFTQEFAQHEWNQPWISLVYHAIARLYFCKMWVEKNGQTDVKMYFVGKPVNLYSVMYVARVVVDMCKRDAREYARSSPVNSVTASNNFKKGFASRISARCSEMIAAAKRGNVTDGAGTALVVGDFYEKNMSLLDKYVASMGTRLTNCKVRSAITDGKALSAGRESANKANLTANGISGKTGTLRIGYGG